MIGSANAVLVSPVSFWEIGVLVHKERIRLDRSLPRWAQDLLLDGVEVAALTPTAAIAAAELPAFRGDPADRFLVATAEELGAPLVTKDRRIRDYSRRRHLEIVW